jgi:hypothetical protein
VLLEQRRSNQVSNNTSTIVPEGTVRQNLEKLKSNLNTGLKSGFNTDGRMEDENKHNSVLDAQIQNIIKKEDDKLKSGFKRINDGVQNDAIQQLYAAT